MTDQQKIYDWCDRQCQETDRSFCLVVVRKRPLHPLSSNHWNPWNAMVKEWSDHSNDWQIFSTPYFPYRGLAEGSTPEEAIAKLAEALGL